MTTRLPASLAFIDLFAGLGGFHLALERLGHRCVFASELDEGLRAVYSRNFGIEPAGDIRLVHPEDIPGHDVLCAGFPCQPFSKAGEQLGFDCPVNGDLFEYVIAIVRHHKPRYLLLENVPNLKRHNGGATWQDLVKKLRQLDYSVDAERLSPHDFGIPQIRERIFIVASREGLNNFEWPQPTSDAEPTTIESVLDNNPSDAKRISDRIVECLDVWQRFLKALPKGEALPSAPIWSMEFGATYPYTSTTPHVTALQALCRTRGSHGRPLVGLRDKELTDALPSYARTKEPHFPKWKVNMIRENREFYDRNRDWLDRWIPLIRPFPASWQKLEWNCRGDDYDIWKYVIQFRASGVRVKRPTTAPSLVAMTTTQVPIIARERRYMTVRECARLQSMDELKHLPASQDGVYGALGNAVNVEVVSRVAQALLPSDRPAASTRPESSAATSRPGAKVRASQLMLV